MKFKSKNKNVISLSFFKFINERANMHYYYSFNSFLYRCYSNSVLLSYL